MKDNKFNGIGREIYNKESIFEGQYLNNELNGFGRAFYYYGGGYYIGEFKNDQRHGKGKRVDKSGNIEDGIWKNGDLD